jgi:hypothetical protein
MSGNLETELEAILRAAPSLMQVMEKACALDLPDWLIFSGAIYQRALNHLTGRDADYGIKDYDLGYFDPDVSYESEDVVIRRVAAAFEPPLREMVEVRNQARVHLWFEGKFGEPYEPLGFTAQALERFTSATFAVGARLERDGRMTIVAPIGPPSAAIAVAVLPIGAVPADARGQGVEAPIKVGPLPIGEAVGPITGLQARDGPVLRPEARRLAARQATVANAAVDAVVQAVLPIIDAHPAATRPAPVVPAFLAVMPVETDPPGQGVEPFVEIVALPTREPVGLIAGFQHRKVAKRLAQLAGLARGQVAGGHPAVDAGVQIGLALVDGSPALGGRGARGQGQGGRGDQG